MANPYIYVELIGMVKIEKLCNILQDLARLFPLPFKLVQNYDYPLCAFEPKRNQYYAYMIIKELLNNMPQDAVKLIGITDIDLCTPVLEYVFGEAQLNGKVAIISYYRLRPEFYHSPGDNELLLMRLKKVLVHELGHCFGMIHCDDVTCAMYLANNIFTLDNRKENYCRRCTDFIKEKIGREYYGKI